jgi:hypothetical protein
VTDWPTCELCGARCASEESLRIHRDRIHDVDAEKERLAQALRDGDQETFIAAVRKANAPPWHEHFGMAGVTCTDPRCLR